ncbi:MAG: hypothetical protein LAP21_03525 [Acidobacteriia bacterium]|nr:hypothetical protein [Terriglobia bacterium]
MKSPLCSYVLLFLWATFVTAQTPHQADGKPRQSAQVDSLIRFSFDIMDVLTNHQFAGQKNSFHVSYEYARVLKGGAFDPKGHEVSSETFPYFQSVRNEMVSFVQHYSDAADFYELFGEDICKDILQSFPQIRRIELTIDIPAFAEVNIDRRVTIVLSRRSNQRVNRTMARRQNGSKSM